MFLKVSKYITEMGIKGSSWPKIKRASQLYLPELLQREHFCFNRLGTLRTQLRPLQPEDHSPIITKEDLGLWL